MISMPALFGREHMIMVFFTGLASGLCLSSFLASPRIGTVPQTTQFAAKEAALAPSGSFESSDAVYKGHDWRTSQTKAVKTLAATPFARCEMHTVQFGDDVIDDWLWFDERDQIAVLPMLAHGENEPEKFLLLRQEKYAYAGSSLATIGGLMEDEETPLSAAQRELTEETGLVCDNWKDLGTYVVSANRGAGHTNPFLARGCRQGDTEGGDDKYELERKSVVVDRAELLAAIANHKVKELKWAATIALALSS